MAPLGFVAFAPKEIWKGQKALGKLRIELYKNTYRTLMGVYLIIAAFTFRERIRRSNELPLTLGPHGSNFGDVVNALQALYHLDAGQVLSTNGQDTLVSVYTLAFIGDMPQQQVASPRGVDGSTLG